MRKAIKTLFQSLMLAIFKKSTRKYFKQAVKTFLTILKDDQFICVHIKHLNNVNADMEFRYSGVSYLDENKYVFIRNCAMKAFEIRQLEEIEMQANLEYLKTLTKGN